MSQQTGLNQREVFGTRLMVHAGSCRQVFAVFRCFLLFSLGARKFSETFRWPQPPVVFQKYCRTSGGHTAVQMGGVLQYKWEAYCRLSLSSKLRSQESTAIQMGGRIAVPYWRCTAVLFRQVVGVGVSETLPKFQSLVSTVFSQFFAGFSLFFAVSCVFSCACH